MRHYRKLRVLLERAPRSLHAMQWSRHKLSGSHLAEVEELPCLEKCEREYSEISGPYQHIANAEHRYRPPAPHFIAVAEVLKLCPLR